VDRLQETVFYGDLTAADVEYLKFEQYMAANVTREEFPFLHEDVKLTGRMDIQVRSSAPHLGHYRGPSLDPQRGLHLRVAPVLAPI
jgi:hypothetical protein